MSRENMENADTEKRPVFLTVGDVAEILNVAEKTVYDYAKKGILASHKWGRGTRASVRFSEADVKDFIATMRRPVKSGV